MKYTIECQYFIRSQSQRYVINMSLHRYTFNVKYNQQYTTNMIYLFPKRCTCFKRFLCPSSGAHNCTHSFRYCQPVLLLAGMVTEMELSSVSGWYGGWDGTEFHLKLVWWLRWNWVSSQSSMVAEMELSSISNWYGGWDGIEFRLSLVWWLRWNWVPSQTGMVVEMELSFVSV